MKLFESFLADRLEEFLTYRHGLGLKENNARVLLRRFDKYLVMRNAGWQDLTPRFFLNFQRSIPGEGKIVNSFLSITNAFFKFMVRCEYLEENPLQDIPSKPENRYVPFILSPEHVNRLLDGIRAEIRQTEKSFFFDYSVYTAITLIARCGLRISESLNLSVSSYRPQEKTIYIEKTKFHKDRLLPLSLKMATDLENYLNLRSRNITNQKFLFPGTLPGKQLTSRYIYPAFRRALIQIGQDQPRRILGTTTFGAPRIHSLRHSFAVNTLNSIRKRGGDPQKGLPVLSAYMGHRKYSYTSLYLRMLDAEQHNNLVDFTISHREEL
jgi:site-specific recombinase XerD